MPDSRWLAIPFLALGACHPKAGGRVSPAGFADERAVDREGVLLSSWRPTPPQRCFVAMYPAALPSPESLVAVADMPALLAQGGISTARGTALLSLKFDSTGHVERARVIEGTLADDAARMLEQVVLSAIEPQLPGRAWGVRLRIDLDSAPRYRVGRSERCSAAPVPTHLGESPVPSSIVSTVVAVPAGALPPRSVGPAARRTIVLTYRVAVSASGHVADLSPIAGTTGGESFLRSYRDRLMAEDWLPELDDRVPVDAIVERRDQLTAVLAPGP